MDREEHIEQFAMLIWSGSKAYRLLQHVRCRRSTSFISGLVGASAHVAGLDVGDTGEALENASIHQKIRRQKLLFALWT